MIGRKVRTTVPAFSHFHKENCRVFQLKIKGKKIIRNKAVQNKKLQPLKLGERVWIADRKGYEQVTATPEDLHYPRSYLMESAVTVYRRNRQQLLPSPIVTTHRSREMAGNGLVSHSVEETDQTPTEAEGATGRRDSEGDQEPEWRGWAETECTADTRNSNLRRSTREKVSPAWMNDYVTP
ncbi:hypothetical protein PR048_001950 [Dryococelus australis]|uniref:Uncharacterized protein n=1 Tax=Dryococelus australis TaxID=614101 RepID=A0ABQ9IIZ6_9NEOP|nr:hypothetical protein PR048_001950 [Dryococelus australis]